jgi:hypothetical protein
MAAPDLVNGEKCVSEPILSRKSTEYRFKRSKIELTEFRQSSTLAESWGSFD